MPPPRGGSTAVRGRVFAGWRRLQCDRSSGVTVSSPGPGVRKERSLIELDCKIGATYLRMSQPEDAERHFAIAMKSFEARLARSADDPFTKYHIASLCGLRGDIDRAVRYFKETLEQLQALNRTRARLDPGFAAVRADPRMSVLLAADSAQRAPGPEPSPGGRGILGIRFIQRKEPS
jgi:tetratricopeptide (TPR) repeat protein